MTALLFIGLTNPYHALLPAKYSTENGIHSHLCLLEKTERLTQLTVIDDVHLILALKKQTKK